MERTLDMDPSLNALLLETNETFNQLTPDEQRRYRREQAISFAWGQLASMRNGSGVTRAQVAELYDAREELRQSQQSESNV